MAVMSALFLFLAMRLGLLTEAIGNCQYFGASGDALLVPMGVCLKVNTEGGVYGSYMYQCGGGGVELWTYTDAHCSANPGYYEPFFPPNLQCGGGICSHVIIREYQFKEERRNKCYKDESANNYFEYAFVTDCWDTERGRSWSLECTDDSFAIKEHSETSCNGRVANATQITEGCHWQKDIRSLFNLNISLPSFNTSFINNTQRNVNDTYFEIQECGGAAGYLPFWAGVLIVLSCLCVAGCICTGCVYYCCSRKKRNQGNVFKPNDPLINQEGVTTNTGTIA